MRKTAARAPFSSIPVFRAAAAFFLALTALRFAALFLARTRWLRFLAGNRRSRDLEEQEPKLLEAVLLVPHAVAETVAHHDHLAAIRDLRAEALEKSRARVGRQGDAAREIPAQLGLGIHFIHVLAARSRAAHEIEMDFGHR